ncbi:ATP-binding protein [Treponema primitia]|uniref:ATP-binding protein n=1 Tax=Treponema primitia TaxID=88058 RepID=UPI0002554FB1|nr:ATP-binding protein [Treponema primitia]
MSIRTKVFAIIMMIAVIIIIFGIGTGLFFVSGHLEKTIESDMISITEIADRLITTEINRLKADAVVVGRNLINAPDEELERILADQITAYDNFMALTIFDHDGIVAQWGTAPTPEDLINSEYIKSAFNGEMVISTTRNDPSGEFVLHVCIPVGARVLSATVSGLFFSDILSEFAIWNTGNIFILDSEGTVIANVAKDFVTGRNNFIELAKTDSQFQETADVTGHMTEGKSGLERYSIYGAEQFCVYRPITGSRVGWSLGVAAPLVESPLQAVRSGLLLVGVVCLLLSVIAAFAASLTIEKPYKTINELVTTLESQEKLLYTINETAVMLLQAETNNFENDMWNGMDMIARCAGVDRMRIWQNHTENGELYCSQIYEWSGGADPQSGKPITMNVSYSKTIPGWEEKLSAGQSINGLARTLSPAEQAQLSPQGIVSILVIPVHFQERFWGFVAFDDCHKERIFTSDDESLLRSGGLLIANTILRNEMTHDIVQARELAIASAEAKSDFLANMSHEMRTPLNAIIGLSELTLDSGDVVGNARENLEKVYNSGVTLLSLINDILDISKIESGKFELIPVEYDTPSLINDTITLNIVRIGSKPITFNTDIDETIPGLLVGDELRIKQIFNNLLSNAFKYTSEGSVDWSISCEQDGDNIWLVSSIRDTGVGIRPEDMEKLFSEYNQVDTKSNRKIEGTGLGLSICKSMVEMMDGTITVNSEYGKGSTFTVRIRQGRVNAAVPIGAKVAENLRNFCYSDNKRDRSSKLVRAYIPYAKVLVVDDVPTNLDVARGMMKPYGMQIDCASSGPEAIELIRNANVTYNAIFMDHMMPGMDGIEATRIIREEIGTEYAKTVPIIALTANAIVGNEDMFLQNGFQAFLSKPIDIMRMDVIISHWVRDKELEKKLQETYPGGSDRRSDNDKGINFDRSINGLDFKDGLKRFGDDKETYLDVLKSYTRNTPPLLDQLRNCSSKNLKNYAIVVHGIKSSSRSIGAEPVGAEAEALELAAKAGDFDLVDAKNDGFIETVQILIGNLSSLLQNIADKNPRPKKPEPDADVLTALLEACKRFDIDEVDRALKELETYEYTSAEGSLLVEWLKEQVSVTGFKQIIERLS